MLSPNNGGTVLWITGLITFDDAIGVRAPGWCSGSLNHFLFRGIGFDSPHQQKIHLYFTSIYLLSLMNFPRMLVVSLSF